MPCSRLVGRLGAALFVFSALVAPLTAFAAGPGASPDSMRWFRSLEAPLGIGREGTLPAGPLDGAWQEIAGPFDPPTVNRGTVVRDSRRHRMLLIDGGDFSVQWALSLPETGAPEWSKQAVAGSLPPPRAAFVAIYDSLRDRVVMHGGVDGATFRSDTWALNLTDGPRWMQLLPADPASPALVAHSAILDPVRDQMLVYGGMTANCETCRSSDVWALPLASASRWTRIETFGPRPFARSDASAVYDPWLDLMVVFGGYSAGAGAHADADTWSFRLGDATWLPLDAARHPAGRFGHVAVVDAGNQRMVIQGGGTNPADREGVEPCWSLPLRGTAAWAPLATTGSAAAEIDHAAIYSPERHSMITYGGLAKGYPENTTDELDLDRDVWTHIAPVEDGSAPPRQHPDAMFVDPTKPAIVVMSGGNTSFRCFADSWSYSLADRAGWTRGDSAGVAPRCGPSCMVYDSRRDRVLSFGGGDVESHGGRVDDISALALHVPGATWQSLPISGPPPVGRYGMSLVYDAKRDRVLMFGGATWRRPIDDEPYSNDDLWQLTFGDSARWTPLAPGGTPGGRWQATMMLDTLRDRLVVHGGVYSEYIGRDCCSRGLHDTWILPLDGDSLTWRRFGPDSPDPTGYNYGDFSLPGLPILDTARDRLLLVEPASASANALPLGQPTAWHPLTLSRGAFVPRTSATVAWDPASDRVFTFGGVSRGLARADLNALQLLPATRQVTIAVAPEGGRDDERARSWRVTVFGSPTFAVDSLARWGATLNGARVRFDDAFAFRGDAGDRRGRPRHALVGHAFVRDMAPLPADSVVAFAALLNRGTCVSGYAKLHEAARTRRDAQPLAGDPPPAPGTPGLRVLGGPARGDAVAVEFVLPSREPATLELLDVQGRRVAKHEARVAADGRGRLELSESRGFAPGIYLVRLTQGATVFTGRTVVLR